MSDVHVCLLSGQLLPNLIPILMDRPARVYLVTSKEMERLDHHRRMKRLLNRESGKIDVRIRTSAPSTGLNAIRDFAGRLADELVVAEAGQTIVLNATGGTKLLSMGFVEVFRERLEGYPLRVIYTDTEHRKVETIVPRGRDASSMQSVLSTDSYLSAQGMKLVAAKSDDEKWRAAVRQRGSATHYLASQCAELGPFLGVLNRFVHGGGEKKGALSPDGSVLVRPEQRFDRRPQGPWRDALGRIARAGLVAWNGDDTIRFGVAESAHYLSGHWLEEYAWLAAEAAELHDVRCSATGRWELQSGPDAPTNEFDLLAVHDNRLLIVECKTGRQEAGEQAVATRLESLGRNAGGLFGTVVLLSARQLPTTMKNRCRSLGIHVLEQGAISGLGDACRRWRDGDGFSVS